MTKQFTFPKQFIRKWWRCWLMLILVFPRIQLVQAQHLDIEVWGQGNALFAGFCRTTGLVGCDLSGLTESLKLPSNMLPVEAGTGKLIFPANFQDLSGGPFRTKNPGFQSITNALLRNELLGYRALGRLRFWDPAIAAWRDAPAGVNIRLFGGLEASAEVLKDFSNCAGQLVCFSEGSFGADGSTVFSGVGIHGSPELVVDITNTSGILHTHLSFFLEDQHGSEGGPTGAYLIELQLTSNARFFPSEPFLILFNAGLDVDQFAAALQALTGEAGNGELPISPLTPVSIPGDVDLDNDVDRIDVALILLAAQNNVELHSSNVALDVNKDGAISRADAVLAKSLCLLRLCNIPVDSPATALNVAAIYDHQTGLLDLNDVKIADQHFRAQLRLQTDGRLVLVSFQRDNPRYAIPARYDTAGGILDIPLVFINGKYHRATLININNEQFYVEHLEEIHDEIK